MGEQWMTVEYEFVAYDSNGGVLSRETVEDTGGVTIDGIRNTALLQGLERITVSVRRVEVFDSEDKTTRKCIIVGEGSGDDE